MTRKNEKIKFALPAYITFASLLVALIIMILLIIPSSHEKITTKFSGEYTVKAEQQGEDDKTEYYEIGKDHVLVQVSFNKFKRVIKSSKYTYVLFGDDDSLDFKLEAIKINKAAKDAGIEKVYYLDTTSLSEDNLEYIRSYLRVVNSDIKDVDNMPKLDLWVFQSNTMLNAFSRSEYSTLKTYSKALYHIFNYQN